jgi:glycerol-3-phosphate acyltransferase PlsX
LNSRIVVAVDAMGGDHAPGPEVAGSVMAAREWRIPVILVGDQRRIEAELAGHRWQGLDISVHHASEVVGMHDSPSDAVRRKKDSSIRIAFDLVRGGQAAAVVSTGNSGATMAAGMFVLKRIPGIDRPAIATVVPNLKDQTLILDVGGNVDCKAVHLAQFALMGSVYMQQMFGKQRPRVGLLSNGEEESKGNDLTRDTHRILAQAPLNYLGYVEGRDIFNGRTDVVVCDGFVGNVVLKVSEGLADSLGKMLKAEFGNRLLTRLGYLLARPAFQGFRKKVDYAEYGGAPLLGIQGTGMICHGKSSARAVKNAIRLAHDFEARQVNDQLIKRLAELADRLQPNPPADNSEAIAMPQQGVLS